MSRINSIDVFKIIVSYAVVFFHTMMYCWEQMIYDSPLIMGLGKDLLMNVVMVSKPLLQWSIPSLFLISGYLVFKCYDFSDIKKYYVTSLSPLIISTLSILLLHLLIYIYRGKVMLYIHDLSLNILGHNNMWFIYNMILMYILAPCIYYIKIKHKSKVIISVLLVAYLIAVVLESFCYIDFLCVVIRTVIHLMIFAFGSFLDVLIEYYDSKKKIFGTIISIVILLAIIYFITYYIIVIERDYKSIFFYLFANTHPHSIFAVLPSIFITPLIFKINTNIHIKNASMKLLIIYLIHPFIIDITGKILTYNSLWSIVKNATINYVVVYMSMYVMIIFINKLINREKA